MKIQLLRSWVLTDEHPIAAKGNPVLIDLETWKIYQPEDRIMGVSAQKVVSLAVEARGRNYLRPEEMHFISRFRKGNHESQSVPVGDITYQEIEFLRRG